MAAARGGGVAEVHDGVRPRQGRRGGAGPAVPDAAPAWSVLSVEGLRVGHARPAASEGHDR